MPVTYRMLFPNGKDRALTLSYDDGVIFDRRLIEIMNRGGVKGTFNINSAVFNSQDATEASRYRRMSKSQSYELYASSGMEVAVHGARHQHWPTVPSGVASYDIVSDRAALEDMFGTVIRGAAYPYGAHSESVVEILKNAGLVYCRTTVATEKFTFPTDWLRLPTTCHHNNPRLMELAKQFVEAKGPNLAPHLFYLWGHSYEFADNDNWNVIEEFVDYIGNRDNIWYATNIEIYDYAEAFSRLHVSMDGRRFYNPTAVDLWFVAQDKTCHIRPGETVVI